MSSNAPVIATTVTVASAAVVAAATFFLLQKHAKNLKGGSKKEQEPIKLYYYNVTFYAQQIRLALAAANLDFTEEHAAKLATSSIVSLRPS